MILFFFFIFLMLFLMPGGGGDLGILPSVSFLLVMVLHFVTILLILGLQVFYIVDAVKNESWSQNTKIIWILALFFGGFFAAPIYWYLNIWKDTHLDAGSKVLESGAGFVPADEAEREIISEEPSQPEPHSWR